MNLPETIQDAIDQFSKIPGIGPKSAVRHILYLSSLANLDLREFSNSISSLSSVKRCEKCNMYAEQDLCVVCSDNSRTSSKSICVIESITDCMAIENSGKFDGMYYILGGVLNPLLGIGPKELNISKMLDRINELEVENIVLAINPSVEGDATCSYIKQTVSSEINIERIGFGMPMGGSLEHLDSMTIAKALEFKRKL